MVNPDSPAFKFGEKAGRAVGHAIKTFFAAGLVGIVFKYIKKLKKVSK